jgi:hypothetical protein
MVAGTLRPSATPHAHTATAPDKRWATRHSWQLVGWVVLAVVCAVALLIPVVAAPVHADDRYWYLMIGPRADGSVLDVLRWSWDRVPDEVQSGRLATIALFERRIVGMVVIEAAVATATPIVVYQAIAKLLLVGGGILTSVAFVRSLRWRDSYGALVRAGRRTLLLVGVAGTVAVAVGAQAQSQFRNGWTSYSVLTYGAVIFIFGSVALLLWLTRLVAERSAFTTVVAVVVLIVLAAVTNLSYELVFPVVPIAALALLIVPVTDRSRRSAGRRAKLVTAAAYVGAFLAIFVGIRLYIANVCASSACYEGVQPNLGVDALRTAAVNLISAVPGAGGNELLADLDRVGWADRYPVPPNAWSVAIGAGVLCALLAVWWLTRHDEDRAAPPVEPFEADHAVHADDEDYADDSVDGTLHSADASAQSSSAGRAEAVLTVLGAGVAVLVAVGTATVMGISVQAQEIITEPGNPYRNTMVTWFALALAAVLVTRALTLALPRAGIALWTALALAIGITATLTLPSNLMALRAYRVHPALAVTETINWEVALGDTTAGSDARRCATFEALETSMPDEWTRSQIYAHANIAFRHYHGQPFCSDRAYPGAASPAGG